MILSDRFVSKLPYEEALAYATFLTQRLIALYQEISPSAIIGDFDGLHGSLAFAVARRMNIPWQAMYFGSIPSGKFSLCADLSPASMITFSSSRKTALRADAERLLRDFEERKMQASASIPPQILNLSVALGQLPRQLVSLCQVFGRRKLRAYLKYTDYANTYSVSALFREALRFRRNLWRLHRREMATRPGKRPYVFFGLHTQPESSIDVFAHFFSNQLQVVESIARSLPPTHRLLVKLHKSDSPNYSPQQLGHMSRLPGVQIVSPYADTFEFIEGADLVFSIQGTIGLEAAMLGRPVIMFGDSATKMFPSVSTVGKTIDLPRLVAQKLSEARPSRMEIVDALAMYLAAFYRSSTNDWTVVPTDAEIDDYVRVFKILEQYLGRRDERSAHDPMAPAARELG
jgi:hypothetical protein